MFNVRVELRDVPENLKGGVYAQLRERMMGNGFMPFTADSRFELQRSEYSCDLAGQTLEEAFNRAVIAAKASGYECSVRAIEVENVKDIMTHNLKPASPEAVRKQVAVRRGSSTRRRPK